MGDYVEHTRQWALNHPGIKGDQLTLILAALDAFKTLEKRKKFSRKDLTPILDAARSRWVASSCSGGTMLATLAITHPVAQECIREMIASRKKQERDSAVYLLDGRLPRSLIVGVLRQALSDRSHVVRTRAAQKCDTLELRELLPDLERQRAVETDSYAKREFEFHTTILRDGYLVREEGDELAVTIRNQSGWSTRFITKKDLEPKRLKAIIDHMRAKGF
jgi:hypothetical protein